MGSTPAFEAIEEDVVLVARPVLGRPRGQRVVGQISLGRTEVERLRPDSAGLDPRLVRAVLEEAEVHHYYRLSLTCTFRDSPEPVVKAMLSVALRQVPVGGVPDPVVCWMDPLRLSTTVTHRRTRDIKSNATITPNGIGINANTERNDEYPVELVHLVAQGQGESQVEWVFTKTDAVNLVGVHSVTLVARTSARVVCDADLALSATREEKILGLVRYRAEIPPRIGAIRLSGR